MQLKKKTFGAVYTPALDERPPGAMYPRVIRLEHNGRFNGALLLTFERYTYDTPFFAIYSSADNGLTWSLLSKVHDTKNGWGMRYQPHLFELPRPAGALTEGTILCAGNSIPGTMMETELLLFKSQDGGATWQYVSSIDKGGKAHVDLKEGERPIWEPYLYLDARGDLVCYYSDERFIKDGFNQLLCHKVSRDGGSTWGKEVFDVAIPGGTLRPGMPIVQLMPNGTYIMVYEIVGMPGYPIYCSFSNDGDDWGDPEDVGTLIQDDAGAFLGSTPYCIWTKAGGESGTVIVSGRIASAGPGLVEPGYFLVNSDCGRGKWKRLDSLNHYDSRCHFSGYSQTMITIEDRQLLQLTSVQISPKLAQIAYAVGDIE